MQDFFRVEGLFYRTMMKVWSLFLLNFLMLVTSLPLITIGAAQTAGFTVTTRIIRLDETKIFSTYFASFKKNFKQSTIIWLGLLAISGILVTNWLYLVKAKQFISWVAFGVMIVTILVINFFQFAFFYLSRYEDSLKKTIINIIKLPLNYPIRSLLLLLLCLLPIFLMLLSPNLFVFGLYISLFIGYSFFHFLRTYLLLSLFGKIENSENHQS